ncbi:signal transduction protein PmrD, partial [Salmonella enterica subsp. enterica]|nr:signal transduction protein PmrD [Salmonella enterica subsp. enterica]
PLHDAQYCTNLEKHQTLKIAYARCYSCDEWQRLTRKPS